MTDERLKEIKHWFTQIDEKRAFELIQALEQARDREARLVKLVSFYKRRRESTQKEIDEILKAT